MFFTKNKIIKGFSLIELLIVIAISGFILTFMIKIFDINSKTYVSQTLIAELQQNIRVCKIFIERDIRLAGYDLRDFSMDDQRVYPINFENNYNENGSDRLTIRYLDRDSSSCGSSGDGTISCDSLPQITLSGTMPTTSAEADVNEDLLLSPYSSWDENCYCDETTYTQPAPGYKIIITKADGSQSDILYLTGVQPESNKLQNAPYQGYTNKVLNSYPSGSTIKYFSDNELDEVIYDIDDYVLRRNSQPIAENIEDLQFAFGLDTTDDGNIDTWINNANINDTQKDQVRSVRINVLGRTAKTIRGFSSTRPTVEDNSGSSTSDGYIRKSVQTTVKVRNLGL